MTTPDPGPALEVAQPRDGSAHADEALVAKAVAGDAHAFAALMRRYNQRLFRIARSILGHDADAEDALQDAYVAAYRALPTFAPPLRFAAWLARIATNEALMRLRARRAQHDDVDEAVTLAPAHDEPPAMAERHAARALMESAIDRLPDGFRAVFVLREVQQLSVEETAACLDIKPATVKTRLHRARALLREDIAQRLQWHGTSAFEFLGPRCDALVERVLRVLGLAL
jgi:RNA polymerase sigma-70 factor (ECF subfamily)